MFSEPGNYFKQVAIRLHVLARLPGVTQFHSFDIGSAAPDDKNDNEGNRCSFDRSSR
jgi:hypothetical protein